MSKYNEELVSVFVEKELGKFINQNQDILHTTVGETILIIQATTAYIDDLLQGLPTREQRAMVVESTLEHTKKLMLSKVGKYEEAKNSKKNVVINRRTRQVD
jgi:hypothetical protein